MNPEISIIIDGEVAADVTSSKLWSMIIDDRPIYSTG